MKEYVWDKGGKTSIKRWLQRAGTNMMHSCPQGNDAPSSVLLVSERPGLILISPTLVTGDGYL